MAELEMVGGGSATGPVQALGRWGILRLLPRWLGEQVAARGRVETAPGVAARPVRTPPEIPADAWPGEVVDSREAVLALRDTIEAWRAAERDLASLADGSPDQGRARAEVDAYRETHRRLFLEISLPGRSGAVDAERR